MKLWKKILIAVLVILILLFSAAYVLVAVKGKALLTQRLEGALNKDVNIGYLGLKMPLALEIEDLEIEGLVNVDYIYASAHLFGLLSGKIILNKLVVLRPQVNWVTGLPAEEAAKGKSKDIEIDRALAQTSGILGSPRTGIKQLPKIIIKYLRIKDGIINFTDQTVSQPGLQITLKDVLLDVDNLCFFPESAVTDFQLMANIPWQEDSGQGSVYASGWINLYKKDIQARLEIEGIDGVYLHPYYSKWVDLENARIEEASLNFISDVQGQNNQVVAQCRLELTDIKFRPRPPEQPEHKAEKITTAVLGIFRALNQGKIILNFTVRTEMDKPRFDFGNINRAVDEAISQAVKSNKVKIEDVAELPAKFFEGLTKGTTGATKAIVEGALSVGKSLLDVFVTEEEPEESELPQENLLEN